LNNFNNFLKTKTIYKWSKAKSIIFAKTKK